jgi:ATP phosphoribosyltransferase regulatory subunit
MFKFQDFDGKIVALRAEMTTPTVRILTTKMASTPKPIRLFYISNVFRYSQSYLEREREFWQAGIELIGCNTPEADGEVLSLLALSLKKLGLKELRIDVGHAGLLKNLLKATGLDKEKKSVLQGLLGHRNKEQLKKFMNQNNFSSELKEAFLQLSSCRLLEDLTSVSLKSSRYRKTRNYLKALLEVKDALANYGIEKLVFFDFSLVRKIEYYSGIVFEASVPNLGLPLGGGGRYDNLIEKFGKLKIPATGFAVEIEKCLKALTDQSFQLPEDGKVKVLVTSKFRDTAVKAVDTIRNAGVVALLDLKKSSKKEILKYAKLNEIDYAVFTDSSLEKPALIYNIKLDTAKNMTIKTFLKNVKKGDF